MNEILFELGLQPIATVQEAVAVIQALKVSARANITKIKERGHVDRALDKAERVLDKAGIKK